MDRYALPKHATLGLEKPEVTVLEWYLACLHPNEYDSLQNEKARGLHLIDPIRGAENRIRLTPPPGYMPTLEVAQKCLPHHPRIAQTTATWMFKTEPTLLRVAIRQLRGESLNTIQHWTYEKQVGFALVCAQAMAKNWANPSLVQYWRDQFRHGRDTPKEKTDNAIALVYVKTLEKVLFEWQAVVLQGFLSRIPSRHLHDAERTLRNTARTLDARSDTFAERFNDLLQNQTPVLSR